MRFRRATRAPFYAAAAITIVVIAGGLWFGRGYLRAAYTQATRPSVPVAVPFQPVVTTTKPVATPPAPAKPPVAKPTSPASPAEINLAVPFLLQAPKQNWEQPFEDACEEASLLMVNGYYEGRGKGWTPDEGIKDILDVVAYEDKTYGYNKDTTANDVAHTATGYFGYPKVQVIDATESNIKNMLSKGFPVIVPADGKALKNPNFRNGGPEYHMLVIKGYRKDGSWITNDPGTRNGGDYVYPKQRLLDAIHDFNHGDMSKGAQVMVVILPQ